MRILGGRAPYGSWTDDTQIVLMVLDAVRRKGDDPITAYRQNLLAWQDGAFTPAGPRLDVGIQTRRALRDIAAGRPAAPTRSSGNACLMVAIGLFAAGAGRHLDGFVRATHNRHKAVSDAGALLSVLRGATQRRIDPAEIAVTAPSGFSEDTLTHALFRAQQSSTFLEGMEQIIAAGGDTDSIGAVYAALSVIAGRPAPRALRDSLVGLEVIDEALGLSRRKSTSPTALMERPSEPTKPRRRWWRWAS